VPHHTQGGVNVLNLVEGDEALITSPEDAFDPFVLHYAETVIVPASVGPYVVEPVGPSRGLGCATIKALVRTPAQPWAHSARAQALETERQPADMSLA
jgi:hypothetical protein